MARLGRGLVAARRVPPAALTLDTSVSARSATTASAADLTVEDVRQAAVRLAGRVHLTPCWQSRTFSDLCGGTVWLKYENLQRTGSYKIRGALNRILTLDPEARARGVIAASAGNHGQGVA
ncbi:MAG TPA: pyridoxal-phosphate dependent enzyme, partial [Chloroflexota bacterium]